MGDRRRCRRRPARLGQDRAQLVENAAPYEAAKLRLLNGSRSALAYLGPERGHIHVHEAIADPAIRPLVEALMREEAAPTIKAGPEQDPDAYAASLLERFANPALNHRLMQIAMDGNQKIPQRWLETLADRARVSVRCPAIIAALAAWLRHVRGNARTVEDPMAEDLATLWRQHGSEGIVDALFGASGLLAGPGRPTPQDRSDLAGALVRSGRNGPT